MSKVLPLRVLCCPRSGSLYTAKLLRSKGWPVGWEHYGDQGIVSWMSVVKSDWVPFGDGANPHRNLGDVEFKHTIAITRHPLKIVGSLMAVCLNHPSLNPFLKFVNQHINIPYDGGTIPEAMRMVMAVDFYVQWMKLIQQAKPEIIIHIESDPEMLVNFVWNLEHMPAPGHPLESHPDTDCHHVCNKYPTMEDIFKNCGSLLGGEFCHTAEMVGYDLWPPLKRV